MNGADTEAIAQAARLWAIRVQDPAFADWDGFTEWLEQAPEHLAAYNSALDDEAWAADLLTSQPQRPVTVPEPGMRPLSRPRRWFVAGSAAAAVVAVAGGWFALDQGGTEQQIATAPGEHRVLQLADGSQVTLNGGTRVRLNPTKPRQLHLDAGEALFEIRHNAADPFVVLAGETRLIDAGTVFNVVEEGGALDVAVSEGAVVYQPGGAAIRLDAGEGLSRASAAAKPVLRRASPESVGSWQSGMLHYEGATLDRVARDLARNLGRPVRPWAGAGAARFTGTLAVSGPPDEILARAAPLLGVRFARDGDAWRMTPAGGASD